MSPRYRGLVSAVVLPERLVVLEGVHNFRDLGGYTTEDGRVTRWRTLYRADGLNRLTPADVEVLRPLGLRTVIDLRTDRELERGRFPLDVYPLSFHHLPVVDVTWDPTPSADEPTDPAEFLLAQYPLLLASGEPLFAKAFHVLAVPGALPAVFHCAAGKDRTGILAGLLLAALGVPHELVAEDYGLSREAMERARRWAASHSPEIAKLWDRVPATHLAAEPAAMFGLLSRLVERHGSVRQYLVSIGVSNAVVSRLEATLLVDPI
jgi:protein-tyrosine phosphatase